MRQTLAETYKENMPKLAKDFPSIVAMAHHFTQCSDMDRALGYSGAVSHWMSLRNAPSNGSEKAASLWLRANRKDAAHQHDAPSPAPIIDETPATIMAVCPRAKSEKVMRVLTMLGVECIEV
jgi:hypothetical protein